MIEVLRTAESYIILGPGEARGELKRRLVKRKLAGRIAASMAADKMTDRQIAAKVRGHFSAVADETDFEAGPAAHGHGMCRQVALWPLPYTGGNHSDMMLRRGPGVPVRCIKFRPPMPRSR